MSADDRFWFLDPLPVRPLGLRCGWCDRRQTHGTALTITKCLDGEIRRVCAVCAADHTAKVGAA